MHRLIVSSEIPWLRFVVQPMHPRIKGRKTVQGTRQLTERFDAWHVGRISFADFDVSVSGWINNVRYADPWGLREHLLGRSVWGPRPRRVPRGESACGKNRVRPRCARYSAQRGIF